LNREARECTAGTENDLVLAGLLEQRGDDATNGSGSDDGDASDEFLQVRLLGL
jgi:hypothetical protein